MSECQTKAGNQEWYDKLDKLTICHSLTLNMLNNFSFHVYAHTLPHSHFSHSLTLDMLNNFCFHVYAQNSVFIAENCNGDHHTPSCEFANHRAGSQLKIGPHPIKFTNS